VAQHPAERFLIAFVDGVEAALAEAVEEPVRTLVLMAPEQDGRTSWAWW